MAVLGRQGRDKEERNDSLTSRQDWAEMRSPPSADRAVFARLEGVECLARTASAADDAMEDCIVAFRWRSGKLSQLPKLRFRPKREWGLSR